MSARNNQDRLGNPEISNPGPPSPPVMSENTEDVFSFPTPTEFVELPSRGLFYPEGHPLHNQEVVEIRYMTAKDEDILTSPALLRNGIAIDRMIENLVVDKNKGESLPKPSVNLLAVDVKLSLSVTLIKES